MIITLKIDLSKKTPWRRFYLLTQLTAALSGWNADGWEAGCKIAVDSMDRDLYQRFCVHHYGERSRYEAVQIAESDPVRQMSPVQPGILELQFRIEVVSKAMRDWGYIFSIYEISSSPNREWGEITLLDDGRPTSLKALAKQIKGFHNCNISSSQLDFKRLWWLGETFGDIVIGLDLHNAADGTYYIRLSEGQLHAIFIMRGDRKAYGWLDLKTSRQRLLEQSWYHERRLVSSLIQEAAIYHKLPVMPITMPNFSQYEAMQLLGVR